MVRDGPQILALYSYYDWVYERSPVNILLTKCSTGWEVMEASGDNWNLLKEAQWRLPGKWEAQNCYPQDCCEGAKTGPLACQHHRALPGATMDDFGAKLLVPGAVPSL